MDPFQQPSRGLRTFRAVPMTHLPNSAERGWSLPSREEADRSGPLPAPIDPFTRGSTVLSRRDGALGTDAANTGNDNVRKWQQFGLRVATPHVTAPPPLLVQQQHVGDWHGAPHNGRAEPLQPTRNSSRTVDVEGVDLQGRVHPAAVHVPGTRSGDPKTPPEEANRQSRVTHLSTSTTTAAPMSVNAPRLHGKELTVVELVDDDDGHHDHHTPPAQCYDPHATTQSLGTLTAAPHDRSPFSPAPVAPVSPSMSLSTSAEDRTAVEAAQRLQLTLAQLSEKVQQSAEEQRCGPPKRPGGGGGGKPQWGAGRGGGKSAKGRKTDAAAVTDDAAEESSNSAPPDGRAATAKGGKKKGAPTRKRGRAADGGDAAAAAAATDGPLVTKKVAARKRSNSGGGGGDDGVASGAARAPRTLFPFSATGAGLDAVRSMGGLAGTSAAAATVSVPFFYQQASTEDLFADIRRALNDPDRIQAPPLFVGISTLASDGGVGVPVMECRTNFTYSTTGSKTVKGRASSCFSTMDPLDCHHHVELVVVRWKDAVHALPAQTLGFPFLCRVLTELPGVEVITFNAQATLIALLAHCKGTLWSHCVSDVRVMAWMAQLHVVGGTSASASAAHAIAAEGGSAGDADMNVLYDYDQLLLRVSAGKPPPSVLLEKASEAEYYHGLSAAAAAPPRSAAPAPPLTPAQRLLAQQVYYLATVYRSLYGLLGSKGLLQAFLRQEKRIALLLALMRYNGIGVALAEVHRYQHTCEAEMSRQRSLAGTLVPELGDDFNIQSHDQCRRALYEVLQLGKYLTAKAPGGGEAAAGTGLTITKGGRLSTAEETLRSLAPHHEFPACLLKYRKASKLMQTYVEGMMGYAIVRPERTNTAAPAASAGRVSKTGSPPRSQLVDESSNPFVDRQLCATDEEASVTAVGGDVTLPGRGYATIHPNFLQEGTDTGRLSCVEPNLQNLPRNGGLSAPALTGNGEEGEEDLLGFRRCFVAPAGSVLLSVDYQQIELRVLAHLCGDRSLVDALTSSADIHRAIAEVVFKKKPVSSEERTLAKRVVFGMLYGAGPKTLAAHMGVSVERALHVTSLLTNAFPGIDTYHRRVVEESRVNGFVRTISGRLRYLPDIQCTVMARRSYAERQAFNSVVQGSSADVMKMAMLAVARDVLQLYSAADVCLLSQIHDEMVFSVRKELLPKLVPIVSSAMSHAMHLRVPLSVTVKFGPSLGDLQEWGVEHDLGLGVGA